MVRAKRSKTKKEPEKKPGPEKKLCEYCAQELNPVCLSCADPILDFQEAISEAVLLPERPLVLKGNRITSLRSGSNGIIDVVATHTGVGILFSAATRRAPIVIPWTNISYVILSWENTQWP